MPARLERYVLLELLLRGVLRLRSFFRERSFRERSCLPRIAMFASGCPSRAASPAIMAAGEHGYFPTVAEADAFCRGADQLGRATKGVVDDIQGAAAFR